MAFCSWVGLKINSTSNSTNNDRKFVKYVGISCLLLPTWIDFVFCKNSPSNSISSASTFITDRIRRKLERWRAREWREECLSLKFSLIANAISIFSFFPTLQSAWNENLHKSTKKSREFQMIYILCSFSFHSFIAFSLLSFRLRILNLLWREEGEQRIWNDRIKFMRLWREGRKRGGRQIEAIEDSKWFWFCIRMWMQMGREKIAARLRKDTLLSVRGAGGDRRRLCCGWSCHRLSLPLPLPTSCMCFFLLEMEDRRHRASPRLASERKWSHRKLQITQSHDINFRYARVASTVLLL